MASIFGTPGFIADVALTDGIGHGFVADLALTEGPVGFVADLALSSSPTGFVADVELTTGFPPELPPPAFDEIVPAPGTISWIINLGNNAWTYDDSPKMLTYGDNIFDLGDAVSIDDLEGFIDNLVGSIDNLAGDTITFPTILKGLDSGEVLQQSYAYDEDWEGTRFEWLFQSMDLSDPVTELTMNELFTKLEATKDTDVTLEASSDGGINWRIRTTTHVDAAEELKAAKMMKQITGRELIWRLRVTTGDTKLIGYWVRLLKRRRHVR